MEKSQEQRLKDAIYYAQWDNTISNKPPMSCIFATFAVCAVLCSIEFAIMDHFSFFDSLSGLIIFYVVFGAIDVKICLYILTSLMNKYNQ